MAQQNTRRTTAYYTLIVERDGPSGPQNIRDIARIVAQAELSLSRGRTNVVVTTLPHDYETRTETIE